jgi:FxsC-like protein
VTPSRPVRYRFFLSYARSAPIGTDAPEDGDHTVGELFRRLSDEVRGIIGGDRSAVVGYVDDTNQPPEDWKAEVSDTLGRSDVFVALYSPRYFIKSVPLRERVAYLHRLTGREQALRLLPVLWVPWEAWNHQEERAASLTLGSGIPDYGVNGLRALCRLAAYESQYGEVVRRLARRIVDISEAAGPRPPAPVVLDDVEVPESSLSGMRLSVMVLAPGDPSRAGWRPYGDRLPLPPAELAANVAERLGMVPRLADAQIEFGPLAEGAVLVLVDPWIADSPQGRAALDSVAQRLPDWAVVVAVADGKDPRYRKRASELSGIVNDRLGIRRPVRRILDADQLGKRMPAVVGDTREVYLSMAPVFLPKGAVLPLPRMLDDNGPAHEGDIDG